MKHSILKRASNFVLGTIIVTWILKWCFTTRLGMFLLLTALGGLAATLMIGGIVNAIAWNFFNDYSTNMVDSGWFWAISFLGSAIWTLDYMYTREMLIRSKLPDPPDGDED